MSYLTICIPTYNRAAVLDANLTHLSDMASRHDIQVYVSDNCSTDDTELVATAAARRNERIKYHRNVRNIGMDGNFATALALADTPYTWLLGDDDLIDETALNDVLAMIATGIYDLILVNGGSDRPAAGRVQGVPSGDYHNPDEVMTKLGWHATWISGLVIGPRLREKMRIQAYDGTYFSHFIALFEALASVPTPNIRWHARSAFYPSNLATFSWSQRVVEIFATRWSQAVWMIPGDYDAATRRTCIKAHGIRTGLFTTVGLLNIRAKGGLNRDIALQNRAALAECCDCSWGVITAINLIPRPVVRLIREIMLIIRSARGKIKNNTVEVLKQARSASRFHLTESNSVSE